MNSSNLKNKLRSNKGATMVFALFALLVSVMIATVVIYTAFSNVGRVKKTQNEEQNYLSVSSAVMLFKNSLEGDSVSFEETRVSKTGIVCDRNWEPVEPPPPPEELIFGEPMPGEADYNDALLENQILKEVLMVWAKEIDSTVPQTPLTITLADESNPRKLPKIAPVEAEVVFDPVNKKMTITFRIIEDPPSAVDKYSTVMTMDLSKATSYPVTSSTEKKEKIGDDNVLTITVKKTVVHTIRWENCVITKTKEINNGG